MRSAPSNGHSARAAFPPTTPRPQAPASAHPEERPQGPPPRRGRARARPQPRPGQPPAAAVRGGARRAAAAAAATAGAVAAAWLVAGCTAVARRAARAARLGHAHLLQAAELLLQRRGAAAARQLRRPRLVLLRTVCFQAKRSLSQRSWRAQGACSADLTVQSGDAWYVAASAAHVPALVASVTTSSSCSATGTPPALADEGSCAAGQHSRANARSASPARRRMQPRRTPTSCTVLSTCRPALSAPSKTTHVRRSRRRAPAPA